MQASDILSRSDIFTGSESEIRKSFHRLVAAWHPDVCDDPMAGPVVEHLLKLRDRALSGKAPEKRVMEAERILDKADGSRMRVTLHSARTTDLGEVLVGTQTISTLYSAEASEIGRRDISAISAFPFADDKMRKQMAAGLPHALREFALTGNRHIVIQKRMPGEILLSDLLQRDGPLDPRHAAWLGSGLLNIACWLDWAKIVHGAISPDMILVDPATHNVRLIGGWGFSLPKGARPEILPERTVQRMPRLAVVGQVVDGGVDLELIRLTLIDSLGGGSLKSILPKELFSWIGSPPAKTAMEDYTAWHNTLVAAWGPRKFVEYTGMHAY